MLWLIVASAPSAFSLKHLIADDDDDGDGAGGNDDGDYDDDDHDCDGGG